MQHNDLISRAAAKEAVRNIIGGGATRLIRVWSEIDKQSAVDAVPVRHGRWIDIDELYECSVCHNIACCRANYCQDCGAKMDEGANDAEQ